MVKRAPIETYCEKKISTLQKNAIGMIDYVDISSVDNIKKKIISFQTMNAKDAPSRAKQLLKKYDILVSTVRPNLNAVAVVESETDNLMVGSTGYCVLRCKENMDFRYLFNFCQSQYFIDDMSSQATGASYPAVSTAIVRSSLIPNYPVDEQRRIASELDKITDLIDKRKEQLEKLDALVKARFVELFGDYRINEKGFDCKKGSELFQFSSGKFLPEEKRLDEGVPVYGGNGIAWYTSECLVDYPTIIIGRVGAQCGNIHAVTTPVWITDNAIYIKEQKTKAYTLEFLTELMRMMDFYQYADFSGQPKITQKPLETLDYIMPPIELQTQFATFVKQTDKSKLEVQKSLEKLELLKKALMQKYFG